MKYFKIDGHVILPNEMTHDDFWNLFIEFIEKHEYSFVGITNLENLESETII